MEKIYRLFIEKRKGFDVEATNLFNDLTHLLEISKLKKLRILYRYDIHGVSGEEYSQARDTVFSDPPQDIVFEEEFPKNENDKTFGIEYLPGQFDQRSDSAAQCIQILTHKKAPIVRSAKIIILSGDIDSDQMDQIKKYCINPVDSRIASIEKPTDLKLKIEKPAPVKTIDGFNDFNKTQLNDLIYETGLAMNFSDIEYCQKYFRESEKRNPTITEIKLLDTYWSDHCRHTTFHTKVESVKIEDSKFSDVIRQTHKKYLASRKFVFENNSRPDCLMDLATIPMRELHKKGKLKELDVSEEINACSIKIPVEVDGQNQDWLIMFKNETHNHPTEIEPFGGAATCLGGAIRDPLSGRAYVYQAMRVTGSGDPRKDLKETLPGKLPQRTITTTAAKGYSSYGNQIGLSTGLVSEIYDEGYVAKRMEIGAVVGAVPAENVNRTQPIEGDIVLLVGGRTGRDGVGGATGSSKAHTETALKNEAEVQKGNPPVERKLQRWFANKEISTKIKRCNDFGAGGVSVAIGELTDSLDIFLDRVPKKYNGLDGTELALSESQERMAVVISPNDLKFFIKNAQDENLEATHVATVTNSGRLKMFWNDQIIVNLDRKFLDTNGVRLETSVTIGAISEKTFFDEKNTNVQNIKQSFLKNLQDLNNASQRGLSEQFDSTIGARSVLHPFGGKFLNTPAESMISKLPFIESDMATVMSWGFNPKLSSWSPYHGALFAVVESVSKIVASGGDYKKVYLTFQEYFEKLGNNPEKWGKPYAALLGAYHAQMAFEIAAIGGKDSMSGSFKELNVPPTLVSFAIAPLSASKAVSSEFKVCNNSVVVFKCTRDNNNLPNFEKLKQTYQLITDFINNGKIYSSCAVKTGGIGVAIAKMAFGNKIGFKFTNTNYVDSLFDAEYGSIICEIDKHTQEGIARDSVDYEVLGVTTEKQEIIIKESSISIDEAIQTWEEPLAEIFPTKHEENIDQIEFGSKENKNIGINLGAKPNVFIPVFPGTNCEYDSEQAFKKAGAGVSSLVFNNLDDKLLEQSLKSYAAEINRSHILMIPGGFSAGDEPEGSGKFIATVFRNPIIIDAVMELLVTRKGLILGICNGFQALIKLGLLPFGEIRKADPELSPTLTFNKLKRHYSTMVQTKIVSTLSPWFTSVENGDRHIIPISNGEGRFVAKESVIKELFHNGQVSTQYVDFNNKASMNSQFNPSGSMYSIEGITSPDGRILGKMAHSERIGMNVAKNVPGNKDQKIFESGVNYFK
ncbi:MAG: phosphoribosylformylglycinamidine synthase [Calditrichaeota bacterium]|nr:MAG: phosphoribosylformylglycinamidine synthase [Calditrichota bacterium]MBL1204062.1 phosphoribosylformylglycinamidine synthase [Calditrichota bacterium]NOG43893.1 phosphoribosylformylglycinamidine synthase [Calditrichota bacterium]